MVGKNKKTKPCHMDDPQLESLGRVLVAIDKLTEAQMRALERIIEKAGKEERSKEK